MENAKIRDPEEGFEIEHISSTFLKRVIGISAIAYSLFHLYIAAFGASAPGLPHNASFFSFHLLFAMLIFFLANVEKTSHKFLKAIFVLVAVFSTLILLYHGMNYVDIQRREGGWDQWEYAVGIIMIVLLLYATKKMMGWAIPIICLIALMYCYFGPYLPSIIAHKGSDIFEISGKLFLYSNGIFGVPLQASAKYVFLFILFSAFLNVTGAGAFMVDLAIALFGRLTGGPAKASVVSSALLGTASGSVVANVVGTGTFTIPLMKKTGYTPPYAGAVEAAASTGGQIMPPVMGAAAFIMAEMLGVPYLEIIKVAIIPAILYYLSLFFQVHYRAKKDGLRGVSAQESPDLKSLLLRGWFHLIPIAVLIVMIMTGSSLMKSAIYSIIAAIIVNLFNKNDRITIKKVLLALEKGALQAVNVAVLCAALGIVVGSVYLTGLGPKLASVLVTLAQGNLLILLVLTMVASIIMGMGLPTSGCYIILAVMVGPALVGMGIPPIIAHLFIFYYGTLSAITPPVAIGSYAASAIAEANPMKTGFTAWRLSSVAFIIPFFFVYNPELAMIGTSSEIILAVIPSTIGVYFLALGWEGFVFKEVKLLERILFLVAGLCLIKPGIITDVLGLAIGGAILVINYIGYKKRSPALLTREG